MSFFCNFCSLMPENKLTVSLINEDYNENEKEKNIKTTENNINIKESNNEKISNLRKALYTNNSKNYSPEKDINGNSIFNMKNPYICIFCGGESCKYENPSKDIKSDIDGIIANLYFNCVYASQRPCTTLIKKNNLIEIFKKKRIKLIVNCQINGEHPYCGPNNGLEKDSGFAYSPSIFISEGIEVLSKGFQDLTPPYTFSFMLDIVKRMAYVIKYKKGRVLVHCHAGNGRTGIVNLCFFIFYFNLGYKEALQEIRKLRKKGVEKPLQEIYCQKFDEYIKSIKNLFPNKSKKIGDFIVNQNILDYNFDKNKMIIPSIIISYYFRNIELNIDDKNKIYNKIIDIDYIPKLIFECIEKIVEQLIVNKIKLKDLYNILNGMEEIEEDDEILIKQIINDLKQSKWETLENIKDINIISEILFLWLNNSVVSCISPQKIENIINEFIELLPEKENINPDVNVNEKDIKDKNLSNNIQKLFDKYINNNINYKDEIKNMILSIKNHLTKVEYEIIKYLSIFLQMIYPTNKINSKSNNKTSSNYFNDDLINEYKRFLYKLSLFLLGYNLDKVNANFDYISPSTELIHSKMLIFIFELFLFYYNIRNTSELTNDEDIFFIYKNKVDFQSIKKYL